MSHLYKRKGSNYFWPKNNKNYAIKQIWQFLNKIPFKNI
jgi:hypothetical protein